MIKVAINDVNPRFSEFLHLVAAGEEVAITLHGEEVARLIASSVKPSHNESGAFDEKVERWRKTRRNVRLNGLCAKSLQNIGRPNDRPSSEE